MDDNLHRLIGVTNMYFREITMREATKMGMRSGEPMVMEYVYNHDGCSQVDICNAWSLEKSNVSEKVSTLMKRGLLKRKKSKVDKRKKVLSITEEGRQIWAPTQEVLDAMNAFAWRGIDQDSRATFLNVLEQVNTNMLELLETQEEDTEEDEEDEEDDDE